MYSDNLGLETKTNRKLRAKSLGITAPDKTLSSATRISADGTLRQSLRPCSTLLDGYDTFLFNRRRLGSEYTTLLWMEAVGAVVRASGASGRAAEHYGPELRVDTPSLLCSNR